MGLMYFGSDVPLLRTAAFLVATLSVNSQKFSHAAFFWLRNRVCPKGCGTIYSYLAASYICKVQSNKRHNYMSI